MGDTASRSSRTDKTTRLVRISNYSKLVRVPLLHPQTLYTIFFGDIMWNIDVETRRFNEGLADGILVSVVPRYRGQELVLKGIDISVEVLDETGEYTVFHEESDGVLEIHKLLALFLSRRELEASSCVHNDSFTIRCTLSKQQATKWRLFSKSKEVPVLEPHVAMAGSNMLTIGSFSNLKGALRNGVCTYSTHFAVAECRWYFQFCPAGVFALVRASNDNTPTTAEFSIELEGVVNFESEKMRHTFNHANSRYIYRFRLEPSTSAMHDDRLIVRCRLAVEKPPPPPAAITVEKTRLASVHPLP
ncbi:unnamed protein product [Alopecurus aequalis]